MMRGGQRARQISPHVNKTFDAPNVLCAYIPAFNAGERPVLLRTVMRHVRTIIVDTATCDRPLTRLSGWSCMSAMTQGPDVQLKVGLIRKARV